MIHLRHIHNETGEIDSSISTMIGLIVLSLIIAVSYVYSLPQEKNNEVEASFEKTFDSQVVEKSNSVTYPEPGSLAY